MPLRLELIARIGQVSLRTARRWCEKGWVPGAYRTKGGHWRVEGNTIPGELLQLRQRRRENWITRDSWWRGVTRIDPILVFEAKSLSQGVLTGDVPKNETDLPGRITFEDAHKVMAQEWYVRLIKAAETVAIEKSRQFHLEMDNG